MRGLRSQLNLIEDSDLGIIDKKEINSMAEFVKNPNKKLKKNNNNGNYRTAKQREYGSKKDSRITPPDNCGELIEYKMPQEMADQLVKGKKGNPQEILCNYVNTFRGLKGYCVKVIPY